MPSRVQAVAEGSVRNLTTLLSSEAKFSAISQALPDPCGITRVADGCIWKSIRRFARCLARRARTSSGAPPPN
jgi:hypothetical protein